MEKGASPTLGARTNRPGTGVRPQRANSDTPGGALMEAKLTASAYGSDLPLAREKW